MGNGNPRVFYMFVCLFVCYLAKFLCTFHGPINSDMHTHTNYPITNFHRKSFKRTIMTQIPPEAEQQFVSSMWNGYFYLCSWRIHRRAHSHKHTHTFVNHSTNRNRTRKKIIDQSMRCNRNCALWKLETEKVISSLASHALFHVSPILYVTRNTYTYWLNVKRNEKENEKCEENISCLISMEY